MINNIEGRNARYNDTNSIDLEIKHPIYGWIWFTADPNDVEEHGRLIYADCVAGKYGKIEERLD